MPKRPVGTEAQIRHALRLRVLKGDDLDWDTILDKEEMQAAYDAAGGMRLLSQDLGISVEACKVILLAHGIELLQQGGVRKYGSGNGKTTTRAELVEIGKAYKFTDLELALLRVHARIEIRACPAICPLADNCWNGFGSRGRTKKRNCGLADHLLVVGLAGGQNATE